MDGKEQQTGRTLFLLQKGATEEDFRVLATLLSAKTAFDGGGMHVWEGQGIGVLPIPYEQLASVVPPRVLWQHGIKSIEPELVFTTPSTPAVHEVPFDHLAALGVYKSTWHGNGIRVAFLDTGLDESHAGFAGRIIARGSMIGAITTADQHGHGTHCTALACGPRTFPGGLPGGVADEASVIVCQVANRYCMANSGDIIDGLLWVEQYDPHIILVPYNAHSTDNLPSPAFEALCRRLLYDKKILVIASAGNGGGYGAGGVDHAANCNAIMAIGATDETGAPASFSPALLPAGDPVDMVAPGSSIQSLWLYPDVKAYSGTSQAAALAAGIAALWAEKSGKRGYALWETLIDNAVVTPGASFRRVGSGSVVAP